MARPPLKVLRGVSKRGARTSQPARTSIAGLTRGTPRTLQELVFLHPLISLVVLAVLEQIADV
jgi:hypothetical protein